MNTKEIFQNQVLEDIRAIARELSLIQNFSGLLAHQQKIQNLYEKYIFLKQLNTSKYQHFLGIAEVESVIKEFTDEKTEVQNPPVSQERENTREKLTETQAFHSETIAQTIPDVDKENIPEIVHEETVQNLPDSQEQKNTEEKLTETQVFHSETIAQTIPDVDKENIPEIVHEEAVQNLPDSQEQENTEEKLAETQAFHSETIAQIIPDDKENIPETEPVSEVTQEEKTKDEEVKEEIVVESERGGLKPLGIEIAEIKPVEKERKLSPIKLDFNDSIAFISQLFHGSKATMDEEFRHLNETRTIEEAKKWMEEMFIKYNWKNKEEFVERLSGLIVNRFELL
ncbi:MAG: hypothetical protein LBP34_09495 [Flavobacteriaceae bacterium]|jgi:hypothetical protein|nr:hypothetical protein [Flavobacteriaceae bacterium]